MTETETPPESIDVVDDVALVAPGDLTTDGDNPNSQSDEQFAALKENIREYGFIDPVIADSNGVIADGEHRWRAARDLSLDEIPVVQLDLDDPDRRLIRQVMNKLSGRHDVAADAEEYARIREQTDDVVWETYLAVEESEVDDTIDHFLEDDDEDEQLLDDATEAADEDVVTDERTGGQAPDADEYGGERRDGATPEGSSTDETPRADAGETTEQPPDDGVPDSFENVDADTVETEHECPNCGYEF